MNISHWISRPFRRPRHGTTAQGFLLCLVLVACTVLFNISAMAKTKCDATLKNKDRTVTRAELAEFGYGPGLQQYGHKISGAEGGFNSVNCYGCVGFIQWCPGTFDHYFGYSFIANPSLSKIPQPSSQATQAKKYWTDQWKYGKNYTSVLGREICVSGKCLTMTQSSILFACQFGCGSGGKLHNYVRNGYSCNGGYSARDGSGHCVEDFLFRGTGYDISEITNMTSDALNAVRLDDGKLVHSDDPTSDKSLISLPGSPQSGMKVAPPRCADLNLMASLTLAKKGYQVDDLLKAGEVYNGHNMGDHAKCLIKIVGYFNVIENFLEMLLSLKDTIAGMIIAVVMQILDYVCEYVVNGINSLLASACLPLPSLGLDFDISLPDMPTKTCDGLSLLNLIQAQGSFSTTIPGSSYSGGASLGLDQLIKKK